jgi:DNA repair photolyase
MCEFPPAALIVQTHSPRVVDYLPLLARLSTRCQLRIHVSIETDRERVAGLPPHAGSVGKRLAACAALRKAGLATVVTVSPLLPIADPESFFAHIACVADAVVIDHFILGDGSRDGSRTFRTALPAAMAALAPESVTLDYRDRIVECARRLLPGRVGVSIDGFAGRYE